MKLAFLVSALASATLAFPTSAQVQQGVKPEIGVEADAPIGEEIISEFRFRGVSGVILQGEISANWGTVENVSLPSGTPLVVIRATKTKACQARTNIGWLKCVIDTDDDGRFDRVSFNDVAGAKDIIPPVPYVKAPVRLGVDPRFGEGDDFKRVYVFTGISGATLTISYREFVNDLARPAFTETLSIPLSSTFPQKIAVKGHVIEIIGIDGMGLHYRLEK